MNVVKILWFAMLLMMTVCGAAQASPVNFSYNGRVTYSDSSLSGVSVGTFVEGTFGYESLTADDVPDPRRAVYRFGPTKYLEAKIAGHNIISGNLYVELANDFGGNVEDSVTIGGSSPQIDGIAYADGSFTLNLASKGGNTGVFISDALPTSYDVSSFDAPGFRYGGVRRDGGSTGAVLYFEVASINRIPEPNTLLLAAAALTGLAAAKRKKILRRVSRA